MEFQIVLVEWKICFSPLRSVFFRQVFVVSSVSYPSTCCTMSFLKPPWPGDYKIASVLNLLLLKSITAACSVHEQTSLLMGLFGDSKLSKMVYQGYKGIDVNLSP
ncbi:LOW QUALITY PROTEIN: hypothetical protein HID58_014116 [Brassica napus]|uniref:Uncharacterized protein n=1 Tax=Brassica napus TaxID=3708 RepID=A0ABQ8DG84_BRANA|nr:LOW QUALITY PROTEIN: hypothetical protein HID58_014116 [Brassica napus]